MCFVAPTTYNICNTIANIEYIPIDQQLGYTSAESYCNDNFGTNLATIDSAMEQNLIRETSTVNGISTSNSLWIGLNDISNEGVWDTWNDGTNVNYTHWYPTEPSGGDEDCALIWSAIDDYWIALLKVYFGLVHKME